MIESTLPTSAAAFEAKYRSDPDPWKFASSDYERGRYQTILSSLLKPSYPRAFEPGCSIGELTAALAERCGSLLATDISPTAAALARARCEPLPNVTVSCMNIADGLPAGPFDLIVMSEIGYYFEPARLARLTDDLIDRLTPRGEITAAHWLGHSADHILHGDEVHTLLGAHSRLEWQAGSRATGFRVDSWLRRA